MKKEIIWETMSTAAKVISQSPGLYVISLICFGTYYEYLPSKRIRLVYNPYSVKKDCKFWLNLLSIYNELLYYQDLGGVEDKRYISGINPTLFIEQRSNREEKIELFLKFIHQFNQQLQKAKRERSKEVIRDSIKRELARLKITRFFEKPRLPKINLTRTLSNGSTRRIPGYQVSIKKKEEKIKEASLLDGVCCFVTNHTEEKDDQFLFPPEKVIYGYRNKRKIEDAFKHLKSFLKIRPFWVNLDEHVRAVYTVCVLAYFLN